ncbi:diaminopimelate epimerase [Bryocella elongata]|uniref:Diaminopimelate epimerase n=1 Tax=Bryocella elongata TaxID=863522 RepID=A0A1H6B901_9BACT|nr:diaminopimelate epimerase [Bryocella elongata]SEG57034.1 diaminopimelate epimerase [Bryocella elongata]
MSLISFVKAHARGNDFLVIEESAVESVLGHRQHAALARKLCSRNTSIGADGIEFVDRRADGSIFLRLFNADGSEAELSGNGTRCVAAWLAQSEGIQEVDLGTHGGVRRCKLVRREGAEWWIESAMGVPRVMPRTIEIAGVDGPIAGAMVNVGNPHFVIFPEAEDFSSHGMTWQQLGAKIAVDPLFRFGTNVEFVRVKSAEEIEFRIFERGCGPTTSSGTGTCASSAAAIKLRGVARKLGAIAEGGGQSVEWPSDDAEMMLTGPAEIICTGEAEVQFDLL